MAQQRGNASRESQEKAIDKWKRDVAPTGRGPTYRPFLNVRSFSSRGQSSRVAGRASGRVHHLFSVLEADCLYLLDWQDDVLDIREQYPLLPVDETEAIARDLGVRHPSSNGYTCVMTTDFLVTRAGRHGPQDEAISVKMSRDLEKKRVREKLEIERRYWVSRSVPWGVVSEVGMSRKVVKAIRWASEMRDLSDFHLSAEDVGRVLTAVEEHVGTGELPLSRRCLDVDDRLGLPGGTTLSVARYAIATKRWIVDLSAGIDPQEPLNGVVIRPSETARRK